MAKPKIYCGRAEIDAEGYIKCRVNGEYCGLVKWCRGYGWWEQVPTASLCVIGREKKNGKTVHTTT